MSASLTAIGSEPARLTDQLSVPGAPVRPRVLYSYPSKLGATRICYTAWESVKNVAAAGADVMVFPGVLHRSLPESIRVKPTLARGKIRLPYKLFGTVRTFSLHDHIVASRLRKLAGQIDIVHAWPVGSLETLKVAKELGIATVLERPNAYTRFAYEVVAQECARLGVIMPPNHEHAFHEDILRIEEAEYATADFLLCPSDFVKQTFLDAGFSSEKLLRHQYGFNEMTFTPLERRPSEGLKMIFVGGVAPRKGLHYALEAWLRSSASNKGEFLIAGDFVPSYEEKLRPMLAHPSVKPLGHRSDVADLMRQCDILILPSIEEGSALVTSEARGSGCVLVVSEAAGAICTHMQNALVHKVGDVEQLTSHLDLLDRDRGLLEKLRSESLRTIHEITWSAAGQRLLAVYRQAIARRSKHHGNA
jgi:glycosyltransferase involved in cell wall biosynthesis